MKPKYRVQGISFPDEALFRAAVARAKAQRRSLSNYIVTLVERDLEDSPELKAALAEAAKEAKGETIGEAVTRALNDTLPKVEALAKKQQHKPQQHHGKTKT